jgi:hypothetical protein
VTTALRSPFQLQFAHKEVPIGPKTSGICFQLYFPNFGPVSHVKNPNFLEFSEGEEERME